MWQRAPGWTRYARGGPEPAWEATRAPGGLGTEGEATELKYFLLMQGEGQGAGVLSGELTFVQACTPVASGVFSQPFPVREGGREGVTALALGGGGCAGRG